MSKVEPEAVASGFGKVKLGLWAIPSHHDSLEWLSLFRPGLGRLPALMHITKWLSS